MSIADLSCFPNICKGNTGATGPTGLIGPTGSTGSAGVYSAIAPVSPIDLNGILINPSTIGLEFADATHPGIVGITGQIFNGSKSFINNINVLSGINYPNGATGGTNILNNFAYYSNNAVTSDGAVTSSTFIVSAYRINNIVTINFTANSIVVSNLGIINFPAGTIPYNFSPLTNSKYGISIAQIPASSGAYISMLQINSDGSMNLSAMGIYGNAPGDFFLAGTTVIPGTVTIGYIANG